MEQNIKNGVILHLHNIHTFLTWLSFYNKNASNVEESIIEDFGFLDLTKKKWGTEILSDKTFNAIIVFRENWLEYKKSVNYGGDTVFMFFDKNWKDIIQEYLCPALDSIEQDFISNTIEFTPYKEIVDFNLYPTSTEILERGETLYKLLLEKKVVEKRYMH